MPQFDKKHIKICGGYVVWDGVTRPEIQGQGENAGKPKWSLKVVFDPNNPDIALFNQLTNQTLQESQFRGVLPQGGYMPIGVVKPGEFNDMFIGWSVISFKTTRCAPDVYDENGVLLDAMQYKPMIYGGQKVDVLAHCYEYNQKSKGIAGGLDAFAIITSANAPRQNFGGEGVDTASAFGGASNHQQPPNQQPDGGASNYQQPPNQQPDGGASNYQQPPNQQPQQAHDFLPKSN